MPRRLGLSLRAVRYHLDRLADEGAVVEVPSRGYLRFFAPGAYSRSERALIGAARVAGERAVMESLIALGAARFAALVSTTGLSKGSLAWHLRCLVESGVVLENPDGAFRLSETAGAQMALALTRPTIADAVADAAREIFDPPPQSPAAFGDPPLSPK